MTGINVVAVVERLALDEVYALVDALPYNQVLLLREACNDRRHRHRFAALPSPPPVVVTGPPSNADDVLTVKALAKERQVSADTVYRKVKRGELVPLARCPGGHLRFRRGDQPSLAGGKHQRYTPPHDTPRCESNSDPHGVDTTGARPSPRRDGNDRRPLGARRAERVAPRSGEPWAPGQIAWAPPGRVLPPDERKK